jgi:galactitol-specific phosphotransferase system IIC component
MFTIYEYAGCLLAVLVGMTLLFTACVIVLVLIEGVRILAQGARKLAEDARQLQGISIGAESPATLGQGSPL